MKNDTPGFDDESNKKNRTMRLLSIRVLYLDLFCTSNTAIWNRKYMLSYMLSCFISGNNLGEENRKNN